MFCSKCGKQIRENNRFCRYCGASVTSTSRNDYGRNNSNLRGIESGLAINSNQTLEKGGNENNRNKIYIGGSVALIVLVIVLVVLFNNNSGNEYYDDYYGEVNYEDACYEDQTDNEIYEDQFNFEYFESYVTDFVLPYSGTERYTIEDIRSLNLTKEETTRAINEIYARRGRIFESDIYSSYFELCDWYTGIYEPDEFDESIFNENEKFNINQLVKYSEEKGWR